MLRLASPFTLPERSTATTEPVSGVPAGSTVSSSRTTLRRSVAFTGSSTLLVSDPTAVCRVRPSCVPAASVTSLYVGGGGGGGAGGSAGAAGATGGAAAGADDAEGVAAGADVCGVGAALAGGGVCAG